MTKQSIQACLKIDCLVITYIGRSAQTRKCVAFSSLSGLTRWKAVVAFSSL